MVYGILYTCAYIYIYECGESLGERKREEGRFDRLRLMTVAAAVGGASGASSWTASAKESCERTSAFDLMAHAMFFFLFWGGVGKRPGLRRCALFLLLLLQGVCCSISSFPSL